MLAQERNTRAYAMSPPDEFDTVPTGPKTYQQVRQDSDVKLHDSNIIFLGMQQGNQPTLVDKLVFLPEEAVPERENPKTWWCMDAL